MTYLKSPKQLDQAVVINVNIETAWNIFNDLSLRHKWTCDVQSIKYTHRNTIVGEAAITDCIVNGKKGNFMTRCVDLIPTTRGEFVIEKDTFGIQKALIDMSFATEFKEIDENVTEFRMQSHYQPKNFFMRLINGLIKKKMGKEVDLMLNGLKVFMETGKTNPLNPINQ